MFSLFPFRGRVRFIALLLLASLPPLFPVPPLFAAIPPARQHEQAVLLARQGEFEKALRQLERLHAQKPNDRTITGDLIVISGWAGRYARARDLYEKNVPDTFPDYVRSAMVNVYRNLHRPETGLRILDDLLKQHPDTIRWQVHRALLLIDMGELDRAEKILGALTGRAIHSKDLFLASAYLHENQKNWLALLADCQNALALIPADRNLLKKQVQVLNHLRAPTLGLTYINRHKEIFSRPDLAWLLTGRAAQLLRWASDVRKNFRETRYYSMRALSLQIEALSLLGPEAARNRQRRQIFLDMLISLRNLRRMKNLQTLYDMLARQGTMPDYVRQALADSLLASRHPDRARALYSELVEKNPKNYQASLGLFYACIEEEDFDSGYKLIDSMVQREPRYISFWDSKKKYPNEQYLNLRVTAVQARFYGDQLDEAWKKISGLIERAPANGWLREVRGQIENARDWPRHGLDDFRIAGLLAPQSLDALAGKGASLIQMYRFAEARPVLERLGREFPREHATDHLERQWRFARRPSYWSDLTLSRSSGPDLNGRGMVASAEIISSPMNDVWYLSAAHRYAWNEIIEGEETFRRSAAGLEYRRGDWDLLARVTYNDSTRNELGGSIKAVWRPDDYWQLMIGGERFAVSTPMRALHHDIRSDAVSTAITYRASEQRSGSLVMQASDFTDGNTRLEGGARCRQRLVDIPHLDIDGRLELYGSTNSMTTVPYYSPEHDYSLQGALHIDHVYSRHYDHLFAQQLDLGYGFYDQKGYAPRWIGHIRYEHRYRFNPWLEALAGLEYGQHVYDGHAEPYHLFRFMLNGKF